MADGESHDLNQQKREDAHTEESTRSARLLFSWWYIWIPVIVVVTLWIGGWWFGNYGGPWGAKSEFARPKISDPAVIMREL